MMGNKDYNTYDRINLRDLCGDISAFSNGHGKGALSEYSSRDAILKKILPGTSDWEKEITVINKLMSGNGAVKSLKMIPPNIEQDDFRKSVMKKCAVLERIIRNTHDDSSIKMNGKELLQSFMDNCKSMFFKEDEMNALNDCLKKNNTSDSMNFMGLLFLHAFANIAINLPHFTANRIFLESLTLSPNTAMRMKLLKCAADCGHGYAALMYANHVYDSDPDTALEYFIIASGLRNADPNGGRPAKFETESNALWEIAFMFENHKLNENNIDYVDNIVEIDKKLSDAAENRIKRDDDETIGQRFDPNNKLHLRDYILGSSFTDNEVNQVIQYSKDKCIIYALKLYLYIAKKDVSFPKAFNSLGKLILGEYIGKPENVPNNDIDDIRFGLAKNYLDTAIHFGNTNAMVNLAIYYHNRLKLGKKLTDSEMKEMRYYLETAAELDEREAQQHLGEILMSEGKYEQAKEYLKYAADKGTASACHSLGKAYAFNLQDNDAIEYFEKALSLNCHDAAYDLAEIYLLRKSAKDGEPLASTYREYAVHLLENRMPYMSEPFKEKSEKLLKNLAVRR